MVDTILARFPGLLTTSFQVTSPAVRDYNCIRWAAGDAKRWWWPDVDQENDAVFWPPDIPVEETLSAFLAAFATLGYGPCSGEEVEPGFEKLALFANNGEPTHAARQLPNGRWTSKLGFLEDIEHELHALTGETYGYVAIVLKRAIASE
jgi:hypothetical protein